MAKRGENIYRRKDGRYEGRYAKGRRDNGSLLYGCVYGYSVEEVRRKLKEAKDVIKPEGADLSLCAFMTRWLDETARKSVKPSTFSRYHDRSHAYIIPMLGDVRLCALSKEDVQRFADELRGRKLSRSTIESIVTTLRSALKSAAEGGLIADDVCAGIVIPKDEQSAQAQVLTRQEQLRLVMAAEHAGQSVELSVLLSLYAGLSTGEMCALRWRDVDFTTGTLTVGKVLERVRVYEDGEAKSVLMESPQKGWRARRRIPVTEGLSARLREYGERMPGDYYVLGGSGKPVEPRRLRAWLDKAEREAGFEVTYRALRRTYASQFMENNFGLEILSQLLGHSGSHITRRMQPHGAAQHIVQEPGSAMRKSLT